MFLQNLDNFFSLTHVIIRGASVRVTYSVPIELSHFPPLSLTQKMNQSFFLILLYIKDLEVFLHEFDIYWSPESISDEF